MAKDYKELRVWQQSMDLVTEVYELMKVMPKNELYSLTDQIKRAAVSIPSNIAEGQARGTKEFLHFLNIAMGSMAELETQLLLTTKLKMLSEEKVSPLLSEIISIKKQTYTLKKRLREKINSKTNH